MNDFQTIAKPLLGRLRCPTGHFLVAVPAALRPNFFCDVCRRREADGAAPVFTCPRCDYDVCRACAPRQAAGGDVPALVLRGAGRVNCAGAAMHRGSRVPMLYCDAREVRGTEQVCCCGSCDGQCGPHDGCACTACLCAFELLALRAAPRCRCGRTLACVPYAALGALGAACVRCGTRVVPTIFDRGALGLACTACGYGASLVCAACALRGVDTAADTAADTATDAAADAPAAVPFVRGAKYCLCGDCTDVAPAHRGCGLPAVRYTVESACWNRFAAHALRARLRCPRGHLLTFARGCAYRCDGCGLRAAALEGATTDTLRLRCPTCDYDLCPTCVLARSREQQQGQQGQPQRPPVLDSTLFWTLPEVQAYVTAHKNAAGLPAAFGTGGLCNMLACGALLDAGVCYCGGCRASARAHCTETHCSCPACFLSSVALALCAARTCPHGCRYAVQTAAALSADCCYTCTACYARVTRAGAATPANLVLRSFECARCLVCPRCTLAFICSTLAAAPVPGNPASEAEQEAHRGTVCVCGACAAAVRRYARGMDRGEAFAVTRACWRRFTLRALAARVRCTCGRDLHILSEGSGGAFVCDRCRERVRLLHHGVPRLRCLHCDYDLCAACALERIHAACSGTSTSTTSSTSCCNILGRDGAGASDGDDDVGAEVVRHARALVEEMCNMDGAACDFGADNTLVVYCGRAFGGACRCLCGGCDGRCGPSNGCACAACTNAVRAALLACRPRCRAAGHALSVVAACDLPAEYVCAWCGAHTVRDRVRSPHSTLALACDCRGADSVVCHVCTHDLLLDALRSARERRSPRWSTTTTTMTTTTVTTTTGGSTTGGSTAGGSTAGGGGGSTDGDAKLCMTCCEAPALCAFTPCGHVCMCAKCAGEWLARSHACPVCRTPSEAVLKIHIC